MKNILIPLIVALATLYSRGQTTTECPELPYVPHLIHPVPTITDTLHLTPPEDESPALPPEGEKRGIFWVHGFGGDQYSWDGPNLATNLGAQGFPARNVVTAQLTYGANSLATAGVNLQEEMVLRKPAFESVGVTNHLRNYVIAHSQGGLVARMTDKQYDIISDPRMFGGIVTFGTPHGGAYILNSRDNGRIQEFAKDGCNALGSAEILSALGQNVSPFIFSIASNGILSALNGACTIGSALLPYTLFSELNTPISQDYSVGATELNNLNSHGNPNVYKVAMHGVEYADGEAPAYPKQLMWRTFSSRNASSAPVFGADDDNELVDLANQQTARYLQEFYHNLQLAIYHSQGGLLWHNYKMEKYEKLATVFKIAYTFMQNADTKWKFIIGAQGGQWAPNPSGPCQCISISPASGFEPALVSMNTLTNQQDCEAFSNFDPVTEETIANCLWQPLIWESTAKPSDGVVLQESQTAFPGAFPRYMDKTNHFQMRNSSKTKEALLDLYNGELLKFFETKPR